MMNPFQKLQDYILESLLPTKLSILIAGSSISLAALSIGLPELLQKIMGLPLQPEKRLLLRIVVPLILLNLGTFTVLLLVIRHLKQFEKSNNHKPIKDIKPLSKETISVLCAIGDYENYFKSRNPKAFFALDEVAMSETLKLSLQEFKYHLEQLTSAYCIERYAGGSYGGLRPQGRAILHEKKLLPKANKTV